MHVAICITTTHVLHDTQFVLWVFMGSFSRLSVAVALFAILQVLPRFVGALFGTWRARVQSSRQPLGTWYFPSYFIQRCKRQVSLRETITCQHLILSRTNIHGRVIFCSCRSPAIHGHEQDAGFQRPSCTCGCTRPIRVSCTKTAFFYHRVTTIGLCSQVYVWPSCTWRCVRGHGVL